MVTLRRSQQLATWLFFAGSLLVYLGERVLGGRSTARLVVSGSGLALLVVSAALRALAATRGAPSARDAARPMLVAHLVGILAVALYALSTEAGLGWIGFAPPIDERGKVVRVLLQCAVPILWAAAAMPLALMHRAIPHDGTAGTERRRVQEAGLSGLSLALAAAFLLTANYLAQRNDRSVDLSYLKTARPGDAALSLVARLDEPVEVLLFFPPGNEVADRLATYFDELGRQSPGKLDVQRVDRLLAPDLAEEHKVRTDGVVLLALGDRSEQWSVGTDMDGARYKLRKLDQEVVERLVKISRSERIAYLTTGHDELTDRQSGEGARAALVRTLLRRLGYQVKNLGVREGLGSEIPGDATVVMILGPSRAFSPAEVQSLLGYLDHGGRLFLALDPPAPAARATGGDGDAAASGSIDVAELLAADPLAQGPALALGSLAPVLARLGLRYGEGVLTNDRDHLVDRHNESDRQLLFSVSFSSHPSIAALSRVARRAALYVSQAGFLERAEGATPGLVIDFTARSLGETWADVDGDLAYTPDLEEKRVYQLSAAVEEKRPEGGAGDQRPMRALVLADADAVADRLIAASPANAVLVGDGLEWLAGEAEPATAVTSEEDVRVQHTRDQDRRWFYGTVIGAPALVLGFGLAWVQLRRRRRNP